jgi:hypothetical protein
MADFIGKRFEPLKLALLALTFSMLLSIFISVGRLINQEIFIFMVAYLFLIAGIVYTFFILRFLRRQVKAG